MGIMRTRQGLVRVLVPTDEERKAYEDNYGRIFACKIHQYEDGKCKRCGIDYVQFSPTGDGDND